MDEEVTWIGLTWREIGSFAAGVVAGIVVDRNSNEIKAGIAAVGAGLGVRDALNKWASGGEKKDQGPGDASRFSPADDKVKAAQAENMRRAGTTEERLNDPDLKRKAGEAARAL